MYLSGASALGSYNDKPLNVKAGGLSTMHMIEEDIYIYKAVKMNSAHYRRLSEEQRLGKQEHINLWQP